MVELLGRKLARLVDKRNAHRLSSIARSQRDRALTSQSLARSLPDRNSTSQSRARLQVDRISHFRKPRAVTGRQEFDFAIVAHGLHEGARRFAKSKTRRCSTARGFGKSPTAEASTVRRFGK